MPCLLCIIKTFSLQLSRINAQVRSKLYLWGYIRVTDIHRYPIQDSSDILDSSLEM